MERKELFKARRIPSLAESLAKRCQTVIAERQEKRREFFWGGVVASDVSPCNKAQEIEKKKNSRAEMLIKWKAEKIRNLAEAKKKQKPIFKVGVVQRKITGSPVFAQPKTYARSNLVSKQLHIKSQTNDPKDKKMGVLTRAKARNMGVKPKQIEEVNAVIKTERKLNNKFCKIDKSKKKKVNSPIFKVPEAVSKLPCSTLTFPYSPKLTRKSQKSVAAKVEAAADQSKERSEEDVQKENFLVWNEEKSQVTTPEKSQPEQDDFRPIHYSPFVTVRSGKKSRRKSQKKLAIDVEEQIKKEEREFQCRIFSFRKYLDCETKRLMERCEKWRNIYREFEELPTDVEGDIDSAIGKTNLLTSDKFNQFRGLVDKCENGDPFIKVDDLQGFQDWVSIEVERIDEEFHRLETRKCNNWKPELSSTHVVKKQQVKAAKNVTKKPIGKSNIRSHILAARKLLKERNSNGGEGAQLPKLSFEEAAKVKTPRKEQTLLREVLNSETKLRNEPFARKFSGARDSRNSGLEIMIATQKNKFPAPVKLQRSPVATDYEVFFGEDKTPNRSILKKTPRTGNSSKAHVTFKKLTENVTGGGRGLNEKYFQPVTDCDENSPMRTILGDVGNLTAGGMKTRSRTRQLSYSASMSPQVK